MKTARKSASSGAEYTVCYSKMGGVDFSSPNSISGRYRFSYLENMYRDYDGEGSELIESVPGYRRVVSLGEKINGFYLQRIGESEDYIIVHSGPSLYRFKLSERDNLRDLTPIKSVRDTKSSGFTFGKHLYILDGEKITRIDEDGTASYVGDSNLAYGYIPTTFLQGAEYEQLNLLTRKFREEYFVPYPEDASFATPTLTYRILDSELKICAVTGTNAIVSGKVFIPSYATIGGERYAVEKIDELAFSKDASITELFVSEGVKEIGARVFESATKLKRVTLPDSVHSVGDSAFKACQSLEHVRFGQDIKKFGSGAFTECYKLKTIDYAYDKTKFDKIEGRPIFDGEYTFTNGVAVDSVRASVPVFTPAEMIYSVTVNGESVYFTELYDSMGLISGVMINSISKEKLTSAKVLIEGYAHRKKYIVNSPRKNFISEMGGIEPLEAITKCTVCECFDGRVFLSGNPDFPNAVFYSERDLEGNNNPLYFGVMNYFNDGVGGFPIISLLAARDSLAVFKSGDDGGGSIFYHTPKETGIDILPKVYPTSYVHSGIPALGETISFFDDPIFISQAGVSALDKKAINLERSIACRSHNVNAKLLSENLKNASLASWRGYLAVCCEGKIFLADSRALFVHETTNTEYEWFYLKDVGTYKDSEFVYVYSDTPVDKYGVKVEEAGFPTDAVVYSVSRLEGIIYYTIEDGNYYRVERSGEKRGGVFSPAIKVFSVDGELLFFGTESGDVCVFNTDKRGVPPPLLAARADFDENEYKKAMGRSIHPEFYSFTDHAPRYALTTVNDDGDIPYFTKNTVKGSLTLKAKSAGKAKIICEVGTDVRGYSELARLSNTRIDFSDFSFEGFTFLVDETLTLPIAEKEKAWIEKQITVYSDSYKAPLGIYSISYRFKIKGNIKKK